MLIGIKGKKIVVELGHSDRLKIYVNPSKIHVPWHLSPFKVHSNDLFSKTTASMNQKFHMQHDQTPRLQNEKI